MSTWHDYIDRAPKDLFGVEVQKIADELVQLLQGRHQKYGTGNIAEFGMTGLIVRLGDKMARLRHGLENHADESLEDTLSDIAGYAIIGLMWERGLWPGSGGDSS